MACGILSFLFIIIIFFFFFTIIFCFSSPSSLSSSSSSSMIFLPSFNLFPPKRTILLKHPSFLLLSLLLLPAELFHVFNTLPGSGALPLRYDLILPPSLQPLQCL